MSLGAGDRVLLALGHVDRDVDVGLVGRDGNLDGVDLEVEVALIHVEGADRLKVGRKLFTAVEVALRVPAEPVRHAELHLVEQLVGIEEAVAVKRIEAIDEARPSSTLIVMRTRLRSSGVAIVLIFTP